MLFLFMGQFALFTYLRPFVETVTHVDVDADGGERSGSDMPPAPYLWDMARHGE